MKQEIGHGRKPYSASLVVCKTKLERVEFPFLTKVYNPPVVTQRLRNPASIHHKAAQSWASRPISEQLFGGVKRLKVHIGFQWPEPGSSSQAAQGKTALQKEISPRAIFRPHTPHYF
jgi:hypothetical protein